ncbi:aspartate 1-decarboxylase [candidate division KSB1 bacterium]
MFLSVLKSKIHMARITEAELDYIGSLTIDRDLMDIAGLVPNEKILVANMNNGNRFETYVIEGSRQSRIFCLNGATALLGSVGDRITIMAFCQVTPEEAKEFKPKVAILDENNNIFKILGGENGE